MFASQDSLFSPLSYLPGVDGFVMNIDPLYKVKDCLLTPITNFIKHPIWAPEQLSDTHKYFAVAQHHRATVQLPLEQIKKTLVCLNLNEKIQAEKSILESKYFYI